MKRFLAGAASMSAMLVSVSVFAGCSGDSADTGDSISVSDVTGTWMRTMSDGKETLVLKDDMTYDKEIKLTTPPPITSRSSDTYSISGNKIQINYSDFGTVSEYIVTFDGDTMKWDNGSAVLEYKKQ